MSDKNFLLVIAKDNVMCMTVEGCNLKFSKVSNARRHYLTKHSDQKNQSENQKLHIKSEQSSYQDLNVIGGNSMVAPNDFSDGKINYSENPGFNFNHSVDSKLKMEPQNIALPSSSNSNQTSTPVKKIKKQFSTPTKNITMSDFGTPPKNPNTDYDTPSNIDGYITQFPEGATCNICGKGFSCMSSARRHYKTIHEVRNHLTIKVEKI